MLDITNVKCKYETAYSDPHLSLSMICFMLIQTKPLLIIQIIIGSTIVLFKSNILYFVWSRVAWGSLGNSRLCYKLLQRVAWPSARVVKLSETKYPIS